MAGALDKLKEDYGGFKHDKSPKAGLGTPSATMRATARPKLQIGMMSGIGGGSQVGTPLAGAHSPNSSATKDAKKFFGALGKKDSGHKKTDSRIGFGVKRSGGVIDPKALASLKAPDTFKDAKGGEELKSSRKE